MLKSIAITVVATLSITSHAEGFKCRGVEVPLVVKVYGSTHSPATREAQVMVISDASVSPGAKTIARFTRSAGTLWNSGANYSGNVDLRFNDTGRAGENIGGTKLGELDTVVLSVDFTYLDPALDGEMREGVLLLNKRNGETIALDMDCSRYLKN